MSCSAHDEIERAQRAYRWGDRAEAEHRLERAERELRYSGWEGERHVRDALSDLRYGGDASHHIDRAERTVENECRLEEQRREDQRREEQERERAYLEERQRDEERRAYEYEQHLERERAQGGAA